MVISVAIDALLLYLTRGKSAPVKATTTLSKIKKGYLIYRKARKYKKTFEKVMSGSLLTEAQSNYAATEFIWPQVAAMFGIGYKDLPNGGVGVELIWRVDASPLICFGTQY